MIDLLDVCLIIIIILLILLMHYQYKVGFSSEEEYIKCATCPNKSQSMTEAIKNILISSKTYMIDK